MLLPQAREVGAGGGRHLRRLGGGLGGNVRDLSGDLLGGAGGFQQHAGSVVDGKLYQVVGIEAHLDHGAVTDAGDRILIAVQLDLAVLADGAPSAPQEQRVEGIEIGDAAMIGRQAVAEAGIGTLPGSRVEAGVVLQLHPGPEGGVQLVDGAHAGDLGFALELVLDGLVGGLDLAFAICLIGWVAHPLDTQLDQDGEQVAGEIDLAAVYVDARRDAVAQQAVAEAVEQGRQLLVEVVFAEQDLAGEIVEPQEQVGLLAASGSVEPDAVAGVGLYQSQGVGRLEGAEGGACVVAEHKVAGALGEALLGQEAIHGAIRDARDLGAELASAAISLRSCETLLVGSSLIRFSSLARSAGSWTRGEVGRGR